jgi:hypothetical protein
MDFYQYITPYCIPCGNVAMRLVAFYPTLTYCCPLCGVSLSVQVYLSDHTVTPAPTFTRSTPTPTPVPSAFHDAWKGEDDDWHLEGATL